jgi:N12 class adenine-specific DNA methylase
MSKGRWSRAWSASPTRAKLVEGPFLLGRTLNKPTRREINSVGDALAVNLDEIGRLNLDYIAELSGKTAQKVIEELGDRIFKTPSGEWQTDDEYLSGNVLQKLEEAKAAAATDPEFERNVDALVAVQPAPLAVLQHHGQARRGLVEAGDGPQFADEVLGWPDTPITYEAATAQWTVAGAKQQYRRSATDDFGTTRRSSSIELLDAVLNNRTIKITDKVEKKDVSERSQRPLRRTRRPSSSASASPPGCGRTPARTPNMSTSTTAPTTTSRRASSTAIT